MGVQHLWSILEPSKKEEHIDNLRDKTLCIDLSLWICEAQGTKGLKDQLKPYLRTVFFRTLYLASRGVRPVFVLDGVPPEIKRETIVKRLQARGGQYGHVASTNGHGQKPRKLNRSRFTMMCNECCEMMRLLGIPFVKSDGEAEATCAWLNENNYADGVLTDDSDVFLYGAKVVYKDFNISSSKHPADYLQVFRLEEIESALGLTRRNMIALALLLGCDYLPAGVPGVGKETAVKLSSSLPGVDLLDRFHEWKSSSDVHPHHLTSLEVAIKRKAVKVAGFPNKEVIKEFLFPKVGSANINIRWKCPDLEGAKEFFFRKLDWPKEYTEEKMLILITDWQLAHVELPHSLLFSPVRIVKPRVRQGKEYYEIEWNTKDGTSKWPTTFATVKAKEIICKKFPTLVEGFESELAAKKCKGKTKKSQKTKTAQDEPEYLNDLLTKITSIDLNKNVEIVGHSSDDGTDKHVSKNKPQGDATEEQPQCEPHQYSKNYEIEDNFLSDYLAGESSELPQDYMPLKSSCKNASFINVASPSILPSFNISQCDLFELADGLSSPALNEKTMFNLADMTVDQNFAGSDLGAVDDLLTDSFVASLQNATPINDSSSHSSQKFRNSDIISFESNTVPNESVSNFRDDTSNDSFQGTSATHGGEVSSNALDGLDDKNSCKFPNVKSLVSDREQTSLASRLLKRFQTENRTNLADKLRSISGEGELVAGHKEMNRSTGVKHSEHPAKQNNMLAGEVIFKNEPFTNNSDLAVETKSSKTKPKDVIVLE